MPITLGYHYPDVYSRHDDKINIKKFEELKYNVFKLTNSFITEKGI